MKLDVGISHNVNKCLCNTTNIQDVENAQLLGLLVEESCTVSVTVLGPCVCECVYAYFHAKSNEADGE